MLGFRTIEVKASFPVSMPGASHTLDDLLAGEPLRALAKGRFTSAHLVRWSAAMENWEKIHYDETFAREVAKLPERVINGSLKQHFLAQFLCEAFDARGWVWRIEYQFRGMDFVGQTLEVRGRVTGVVDTALHRFVSVEVAIVNADTGAENTTARGVVVLARDGAPLTTMDGVLPPAALVSPLDRVVCDGDVPAVVRSKLGCAIETLVSYYPVGLSRLRLFAEAVMGLRPVHFDPAAAADSPFGTVVGSPLFPMHAIEHLPGTARLEEDERASGREGSSGIVGRGLAPMLGIDETGLLNGGSMVEVRSLVRCGGLVRVDSVLTGARRRQGRRGGDMLFLERTNTYCDQDGRVLLVHRPTTILRMDVTRF
jgi:acyl dehydratase